MGDKDGGGAGQERKTERPDEDALRHSLRLVMWAWVFGAVWMYICSGAVMTRFAQCLDLPPFGYGLLAALPYAGTLMQLPTSYFIEKWGYQKPLFIGAGIAHRFVWVLIGLVPWMAPEPFRWIWLLVLVFLTSAIAHISTPVWYSWMGDLVPTRLRGRYFSRRVRLGQGVGVVITLLTGYFLDRVAPYGRDAMLKALAAALVVAGIFGMVDFLFFIRVLPPSRHRPNPNLQWLAMLKQPLSDANFRRFMGFTATLTFAIGYVGQFVWLYLFDVGFSNMQANVMLILVPLLVMMFSGPFWGRVIDRFGRKPVLMITGFCVVNGAVVWLFVTPERWVAGYLLALAITFAWPGLELANFNILLSMSESLSGRRYGTAYIAVSSVVTAIAGFASGLFGGAVAEWVGDWHTDLFGWRFGYQAVLFILSAFFRLLALAWLPGLEDAGSHSARATLRYVAGTLYSNLQGVVLMPVRAAVRVGRLTYKMHPRSRA